MKFQKILTTVTLIIAALCIVLSLSFCSGVFEAARHYSIKLYEDDIWGADALYVYGNQMNDILLIVSIVLLLSVVLLCIMGCNKRRNYYITNYVAIGIFIACALVFGIILIIVCANCLNLYGQIDFAAWKEYENEMELGTDKVTMVYSHDRFYNDNCASVYIGIVMFVVLLAEIAAWVLNLIWKLKLMKGEKALLEQGAVEKKAELEVA
ncbi:MAG: hypothetical protein NC131_03860 [Roseburia sp.]|nr:hypothetical protein [Roseburia sp.]